MAKIIILFGMMACLFGPMIIFGVVGYNAMRTLSKRPSQGASVMIPMITKLVFTSVILIGILMEMLHLFAD